MFGHLRVSQKLTLLALLSTSGFILILLVNGLLGRESGRLLVELEDGRVPALELSLDLEETLRAIHGQLESAVVAFDSDALEGADRLRDAFRTRLRQGSEAGILESGTAGQLEAEFDAYYETAREAAVRLLSEESGEALTEGVATMRGAHERLTRRLSANTTRIREDIAAGFAATRSYQRTSTISMAVITVFCIVLLGGSSFLLARKLSERLQDAAEMADLIAQGDLSASTAEATGRDETDQLLRAMQKMADELRRMVGSIGEASAQVASSSGELSASARAIHQGARSQADAADETAGSMAQMAASTQVVERNARSLANHVDETRVSITRMGGSIEAVAESSDRLASTVADTSATVEQMTAANEKRAVDLEQLTSTANEASTTIEEMTRSVEAIARSAAVLTESVGRTRTHASELAEAEKRVAKMAAEADRISRKAAEDAHTGDSAIATTLDGMRSVSERMDRTAAGISDLGERSQQIGKILGVIERIADQTNLLALNAAIEAARAGEAGRGFAVVADEVRKLAESSIEATKEIGTVVRQVQDATEAAVKMARDGAAEAKGGIQLADKAGIVLRSIIESVARSSELMANIAASTAQQSAASAGVQQTVADMSRATDEVTTAVNEQAAGSRRIREAVESINGVMLEVGDATREQVAGGRQVLQAVEAVKRIAGEVKGVTGEQAHGSRQIVRAVESMAQMTHQVSQATAEQRRGGELVVQAMENISTVARDNLSTVEEMSQATTNLARQAEKLAELIASFRSAGQEAEA